MTQPITTGIYLKVSRGTSKKYKEITESRENTGKSMKIENTRLHNYETSIDTESKKKGAVVIYKHRALPPYEEARLYTVVWKLHYETNEISITKIHSNKRKEVGNY